MTGIPSQDEDTSEKLAVVSKIENNQLVIIVPLNEHRILKVIEKLPTLASKVFMFSQGERKNKAKTIIIRSRQQTCSTT